MEKVRSVCLGWRWVLFGFLITLLWSTSVLSADVTLAWDPNSEPDLEGYGVYFRKGTPGPPYDLAGYLTLADLSNDYAPLFVVSGLEKGARYYFSVTAYDTAGNESTFSSAVCADVGDTITACADASSSGSPVSGSGGGGGGGGGGCFISASSEAKIPIFLSLVALAITGCIMMRATTSRQG
jgi:Fibronectin type III domain